MKAKMPNKPAEAAIYMCTACNSKFRFQNGKLICPKCKNTKPTELVIVDIRNNPQEEELYTEDDWHGG